MTRRLVVILASCTAFVLAGCTSMNSTMLTRDESNQFWTRKAKLKGVPITLKVPTHVKLLVFEKHFLEKVSVGGVERTRRLRLPFVVRDFAQEFIYTEKIFTVDFKRPAGGTYNLRLDMTKDQYIEKLQHDVTDQTIEQVTSAIKAIGPSGGFFPTLASGSGESVDQRLQPIESLVAVGVFAIDEPDFEEQVGHFINSHLNQANDAWVAPPGVNALHRTSLKDSQTQIDLQQPNIVVHSSSSPHDPVYQEPLPQQEAVATPQAMPEAQFPHWQSPVNQIYESGP